MPDLGRIPVAREFNAVSDLTTLSYRHNEMLEQNLEQLKVNNPSVHWMYFDVRKTMDEMLAYPTKNGFINVTDTCYEAAMDDQPSSRSILKIVSNIQVKFNPDACNGYLFFDPVHPKGQAHRLMAERTRELLLREGIELG